MEEAQQLVDDWVRANVLPVIRQVAVHSYHPNVHVVGAFGKVIVARPNRSQVKISYTNERMVRALQEEFGVNAIQPLYSSRRAKRHGLQIALEC